MNQTDSDFSGRVALVTGGTGDIGTEVAVSLAKRNATVVLADIRDLDSSKNGERLRSLEPVPDFVQCDVSQNDDVKRLFGRLLATHQVIDILVNCAGVSSVTPILDITSDEWDAVVGSNLRSAFLCSQAALRTMKERKNGTIVNFASAAAKLGGVAVGAHYAASKAAIICLTISLAKFAAPFNTRVNCVCPGPVVSSMTDSWGKDVNDRFVEMIPLQRYASAQDVANAVVFLASDSAKYVTGETLDVNGGLVMD